MTHMFNGVALTPESIEATRQWYARNARNCIAEAEAGRVTVNDLARYVAWHRQREAAAIAARPPYSVAFLQRAYYFQTGESVALLP